MLKIEQPEKNHLVLKGRLDSGTVDELKKVLQECQGNIVINIAEVDYINSAGLGLLLGTYQRLKESDGEVVVTFPSDYIKDIFKVTGLEYLIRVTDEATEE